MPGNPTRKGLRDCCAAEVMNELVVGMPNPRELVPRPEGRSWIGVDAWIRTGPVDSEIAARTKGSVEPT